MADWVHCNICFRQPAETKQFHLTSCGHMFCGDCLSKGLRINQNNTVPIQYTYQTDDITDQFLNNEIINYISVSV